MIVAAGRAGCLWSADEILPKSAAGTTANPMNANEPHKCQKVIRLGNDREITIRPIRPEDADIEQAFVRQLSPETRRKRFLAAIRELTPGALQRFTRPVYPGSANAEFAIVVADEWQGKGLGRCMMQELLAAATSVGIRHLEGLVLRENRQMLQMVRDLGFCIENHTEEPDLVFVRIELPLPHAAST